MQKVSTGNKKFIRLFIAGFKITRDLARKIRKIYIFSPLNLLKEATILLSVSDEMWLQILMRFP